jgi:hypothetical protein
MPEADEQDLRWKCVFCRMKTATRVLRAPLCAICWDQMNDFVWVSFIQIFLLAIGAISGLFFVLIFVKHRIPPILGRFTEQA